MLYKNKAGEDFLVVLFKSIEEMEQDHGSPIERVHLRNQKEKVTLCGNKSEPKIGFMSFPHKFPPCLECAKIAYEMGLEPYRGDLQDPILAKYPHLDFYDEPYNPKRANRFSWNIKPMAQSRTQLHLTKVFSQEEYHQLRLGIIPREMENKWFIYLEGEWLYFHRSWAGICRYQVRMEKVGKIYRVVEAWVNRDSDQYKATDDDYDLALLEFLIDGLLLNKDASFPFPNNLTAEDGLKQTLYWHHIVGNSHPKSE